MLEDVVRRDTGVDAGGTGLLDVDLAGLGEPALDLANLLVHLELRVEQGLLPAELAGSAAHAVLAGYDPPATSSPGCPSTGWPRRAGWSPSTPSGRRTPRPRPGCSSRSGAPADRPTRIEPPGANGRAAPLGSASRALARSHQEGDIDDHAAATGPGAGDDALESELRLLKAAVEAGLDGMVVVSSAGSMIAYNDRFAQMWPIPADVIASGSDDDALQSVLGHLVDPDAFLERVRAMYARASGQARDELVLRDGRVFDRYGTALHQDDGGYLGWAWYFRDVTDERTRARQHRLDSERHAALAADAARLGALVGVAQELADAAAEPDVLRVVAGRGAAVLEAQGVLLCLTLPDSAVRALTTSFFDAQVRAEIAVLPGDFPLPMVHAATTGTAHFFPDCAAALAQFPGGAELYHRTGTQASAAVPLRIRGAVVGSLAVAYEAPRTWRPPDRELLSTLALLTAQALDRIAARQAEQEAVQATRRLSESLQRGLLTDPPAGDLDIAVAYQPAAQDAQVGGDWYDAFRTPDGGTTLVVGDVAGHDRDAAAAMAQVRNVLRGVAQTLDASPAGVLSALDRAMAGLQIPGMATAVLCQVPAPRAGEPGRRVRWASAGHPPPLLLRPDGTAELLVHEPDLLLGLQPDTARTDHEVVLAPGATLVLYTDGLIERRYESLDHGLERLRASAEWLHALPTTPLCLTLAEQLASSGEDDVALLVARVPRVADGTPTGTDR